MKRVVILILCLVLVLGSTLLFAGCGIFNKKYTSGDFIYRKYVNPHQQYVEILGLSEEGRTKEVIVIPETIDGLPVTLLEATFMSYDSLQWNSTHLTKVYLVKQLSVWNGTWSSCPNLKQVFVINADEDVHASGELSRVNLYIFKELYDYIVHAVINPNALSNMRPANVTFYYNYFGAANDGCYWLDQVEVGERIEFIPSEPTRKSNNHEYIFEGWYTEKECINKWDFATDVMPESGELELYANWF